MTDDDPSTLLETLQRFLDRTLKVEATSSRIDKITQSIATQYQKVAKGSEVFGLAFQNMTRGIGSKSSELAELQKLLTNTLVEQNNANARREQLLDRQLKLEVQVKELKSRNVSDDDGRLLELNKELQEVGSSLLDVEAKLNLVNRDIAKLREVSVPAARALDALAIARDGLKTATFLTGFERLIGFSNDLNREIIAANSSLRVRGELLQASLNTQFKIAASAKTITDVQRELANIGADLRFQQEETLRYARTEAVEMAANARHAAQLLQGVKASATSGLSAQTQAAQQAVINSKIVGDSLSSSASAADNLTSKMAEQAVTARATAQSGENLAQSMVSAASATNRSTQSAQQLGSALGAVKAQTSGIVANSRTIRELYEDTLETATMLVEGLGLSAKESVQLSITARAANIAYRDMADLISEIVDTTAVAADEAARYVRQLTVAGRIAAGTTYTFNTAVYRKNIETLAGIEGAIKNSIGVQGEISTLLARFASYQDLGGLGAMFGTGGIEFLDRPTAQIANVLGNIAQTVGDAKGPLLEAYAAMLQVRPETLVALVEQYRLAQREGKTFGQFIEDRNKAQIEANSLQERYSKQLSEQGAIWSRLGQQIFVLANTALLPLARSLQIVGDYAFKLAGIINPNGPLGTAFKLLVGPFVTGYLVKKLVDTTRAIFSFGVSIISLQRTLRAAQLENLAQSIIPVGGGGRVPAGSRVPRVPTPRAAAGGAIRSTAIMALIQRLTGPIGRTFSRVFARVAASSVGRLLAGLGKGIVTRVLGAVAGFLGSTFLKGMIGRALAWITGTILSGGWALVVGLAVTLLPMAWDFFKKKSASDKQSQPISIAKTNQAVDALAKRITERDANALGISMKAYESIVRNQNLSREELTDLNRRIVAEANRRIDVQSGTFQRDRGVDRVKDAESLRIIQAQEKLLAQMKQSLDTFSSTYRQVEQAKSKDNKNQVMRADRKQTLADGTQLPVGIFAH